MAPLKDRKRPKVLIASGAVQGGVERHLCHLLAHVPHEQFDVHLAVAARRDPGALERFAEWRRAGFCVHEIPMEREVRPHCDFRTFLELFRLCARERYDLVHTHCAKAGFLGRLVARLTGAKTLHTPHVFPFGRGGNSAVEGLYRAVEKVAARWTDRMVLLSRYQANLALRYRLLRADRIAVIPNGTDFGAPLDQDDARRELGIPARQTVAVVVGRLCEQKGLDVLLDAVALLRAEGDTALRVLLVGSGPLEREIKARIDAEGLGGVISMAGATRRPDLYYAAADLVLMPSRYEGMPYVILEARAAGRPVAVSLCSGMEEFVRHGWDGFLVPPGNAEAWARILQRACRHPEEMKAAGERARRGLRADWTVRISVERLWAVYAALLHEKEGAQPSRCLPGSDD